MLIWNLIKHKTFKYKKIDGQNVSVRVERNVTLQFTENGQETSHITFVEGRKGLQEIVAGGGVTYNGVYIINSNFEDLKVIIC
jgi:hypothetical protein